MAFKTLFAALAFVIAVVNAATLNSIIDSLEDDAVRRCGTGCDKDFIKRTFNYFSFACRTGGCEKDFVLRVTPLGSASHIQEYCVLSEPFHSPNWSVRIQADLIPQGARMVFVAVPRNSRTELERFRRPFVLSSVIPRNQLHIIQQMVRAYCGTTV